MNCCLFGIPNKPNCVGSFRICCSSATFDLYKIKVKIICTFSSKYSLPVDIEGGLINISTNGSSGSKNIVTCTPA